MMLFSFLIISLTLQAEGCLVTRLEEKEGFFSSSSHILRNFDFEIGGEDGYGRYFLNPRNYTRISLTKYEWEKPAKWISKYRSITFNLVSESFAQDGINEAGLSIHTLVIKNRYNSSVTDVKLNPTINEFDMIQFMVDQAANVNDAVKLLRTSYKSNNIRVTNLLQVYRRDMGQLLNYHWAMCDSGGQCALLRYFGDQIDIVNYQSRQQFIVTNNDADALSKEYERVYEGNFPLSQKLVTRSSFPRYANARFYQDHQERLNLDYNQELKKRLKNYDFPNFDEVKSNSIYKHFYHLDRCSKKGWNKYQMVVVLKSEPNIYFRTRYYPDVVHHINFTQFNWKLIKHPVGASMHMSKFSNQVEMVDLEVYRKEFHMLMVLMDQKAGLSDAFVEYLANIRNINQNNLVMDEVCLKPINNNMDNNYGLLTKLFHKLTFVGKIKFNQMVTYFQKDDKWFFSIKTFIRSNSEYWFNKLSNKDFYQNLYNHTIEYKNEKMQLAFTWYQDLKEKFSSYKKSYLE